VRVPHGREERDLRDSDSTGLARQLGLRAVGPCHVALEGSRIPAPPLDGASSVRSGMAAGHLRGPRGTPRTLRKASVVRRLILTGLVSSSCG
jgi:hypothetical protein